MGAAEMKAGHEEEYIRRWNFGGTMAPVRQGETQDFALLGRRW